MDKDEFANFILSETEEKTFEEVVLSALPCNVLTEKTKVNELHKVVSTDNLLQRKETEITNLLVLPQKDAAKILGIPNSTLCKRWKEVQIQKYS